MGALCLGKILSGMGDHRRRIATGVTSKWKELKAWDRAEKYLDLMDGGDQGARRGTAITCLYFFNVCRERR